MTSAIKQSHLAVAWSSKALIAHRPRWG